MRSFQKKMEETHIFFDNERYPLDYLMGKFRDDSISQLSLDDATGRSPQLQPIQVFVSHLCYMSIEATFSSSSWHPG